MSSIKSLINMKATQFSACKAGMAYNGCWGADKMCIFSAVLGCHADTEPHTEFFNFRLLEEVPGLP